MLNWKQNKAIWLSVIFILAITIGIATEFYYLMALPIIIAVVLVALLRYDYLVTFIVFATPLSFNFEGLQLGGIGFYFPTEPLIFGLMLLFFLQLFRKSPLDKRIPDHMISIAIIFNLFWLGVTTYTSQIPIVSFKFFLARLWFVVVLYFLVVQLFKEKTKIKQFLWLYLIPLCIVVVYTLVRHASKGFAHEPAHYVMSPFYKDHTSYGAILAMYFPVLWAMLLKGKNTKKIKGILIGMIVLVSLGLIFSYTRAAWVSLLAAAVIFVIVYFKIPFKITALAGVVVIVSFFVYQDYLVNRLEKNRKESSDNLSEHVESISNISSDASNMERLNRWSCAYRMFLDRPFLGFGPGTYMFLYAPYQKASEKTIISTNQGDVGNAHSEYLGPLSESGLFGMLTFLLLMGFVIYKGITLYQQINDEEMKYLIMGILLGLITYFVHGVLNNYLDTDKASVPFWTFIASIVAIDLWHKNSLMQKADKKS